MSETRKRNPRLVRLQNDEARAWVYPEQGFQLHGFEVRSTNGAWHEVILAAGDDQERFGNPVLFPCPGLSSAERTDCFVHGERLLPMPKHGFAMHSYWHLLEQTQTAVTGELHANPSTRLIYPYDPRLRLEYCLEGATLVLRAEVRNQGEAPLPYGLGFHPYLRLAGGPGRGPDASSVSLPAADLVSSPDDWRNIEQRPWSAQVRSASDSAFFGSVVLRSDDTKWLELTDARQQRATRVSVEASPTPFGVWVLWRASPESPYLCLEPWTHCPNALNRNTARLLQPGESHHYRMALSVRP